MTYVAVMDKHIIILAEHLGILLRQKDAFLTVAESCTGGGVAAAITAIAGSSAWFELGLVTYSNGAKMTHLNVPAELIAKWGVVSEAVAKAMADGALIKAQADYTIAVSGIAGPSGGTPEKPVGTVCIAWGSPREVIANTFLFVGDRNEVRQQAVEKALTSLIGFMDEVESTV